MYLKLYFDEKPLFLTEQMEPALEPYAHHDDAVLMDELSTPAINSILHEMRQPKVHAGIFIHTPLADLKKAVWKKFQLVQAAGGLVRNEAGQLLLIFRRGKWDLPKGKLDSGESLEACAVREVKEETGLKAVQVVDQFQPTYHTYTENGHSILKETYWYWLSASNAQQLVPQATEQITDIRWVDTAELPAYATETYASIRDLWVAAGFLH